MKNTPRHGEESHSLTIEGMIEVTQSRGKSETK